MNKTSALIAGAVLAGAVWVAVSPSVVTEPGPVIVRMERNDNVSAVSFSTTTNGFYILQTCTNLASPVWVTASGSVRGNGLILSLSDSSSSHQRFYRVVKVTSIPPPPPYPPIPLTATNGEPIL